MMTKKLNFEAIAEAISSCDAIDHQEEFEKKEVMIGKKELIWNLINFLEEENPNFDKEKFEEACY